MNKFKCKNSFDLATSDTSYTITTPESHQVSLPNRVVFVQNGLPDAILHQPHVSVSQFKGIAGVIETLNKILQTGHIDHTLKQERSYDI